MARISRSTVAHVYAVGFLGRCALPKSSQHAAFYRMVPYPVYALGALLGVHHRDASCKVVAQRISSCTTRPSTRS
jgi:hypothetical protein